MSETRSLAQGAGRAPLIWADAPRLAFRELRSGLKGFYIFIACIALGVAVITAVGALSDALRAGFDKQAETILGGDVTFARMHARASDAERRYFASLGTLSETATLRSMARRLDGSDQSLVEIKAIDGAYPLSGAAKLQPDQPLATVILQDGNMGAAGDPMLLERLGVKIGDKVKIGEAEVTVAATVVSEPDGLADRLTYGPRIFLSHTALEKTGLIQPGTLVRWRYAVKLPSNSDPAETRFKALREEVARALPESGFSITDRRDPSPQMTRTLDRLRQFLTLIGLAALLVGGVGVANAVAVFVDKRRKVIATFKSLGATNRMTFQVFLIQILAVAVAGIAIGLLVGAVVPWVLIALFGANLPIAPELGLSARTLAIGAVYGLLVALLFALWPLGRTATIRPSVLFRDEVGKSTGWPPPTVVAATVAIALLLVLLAVLLSESKKIALFFCAAWALVFVVFLLLGEAVTHLARRMRRPAIPEVSLAIGNLGAPGGLTRSVVLSLGAGLSLLVAVALADHSLVDELSSRLPAEAPAYFLLDIPKTEAAGLKDAVMSHAPAAKVVEAPMLRGRLIKLKDQPVEVIKAPPEAQWVLNGDRGLTYADDVPEGSKVTHGVWWDKGYSGEPLVSFEADLAQKLGVGIGDMLTVNVLGRNVTAKIANLREVKWESLALNFVMVFSPNTLAAAPHNILATITLPPDTSVEQEVRLAREIGKAYPAVTTIRVKDAINAFDRIFTKIMTAVRVAGSVTLAAGALVLAGALATAQRRRILEAVILKTLGATRRRIMAAHVVEYLSLATIAALFAVLLGTLAAYIAVTQIMEIEFAFSWAAVAEALGLSICLVLIFGGLGTWSVLKAPAVPYLKSE